MGFIQKVFGICRTKLPADAGCWSAVEGGVEVDLARAGELAEPGGALRIEGAGLPQRVLVVHGLDGEYHAFRNRCTHAGGRRLDPEPGQAQVRCCSVGQSLFDYAGKRISGSATDDLPVLPLEQSDGRLVVRFA